MPGQDLLGFLQPSGGKLALFSSKVKILEIRSSLLRELGGAMCQVEGLPLFGPRANSPSCFKVSRGAMNPVASAGIRSLFASESSRRRPRPGRTPQAASWLCSPDCSPFLVFCSAPSCSFAPSSSVFQSFLPDPGPCVGSSFVVSRVAAATARLVLWV